MVAVLRELFAKSKQPSHEDRESAAHMLASIIEQAQAIGRAHAAAETQERTIAWGGKFVNALQSGWDIVSNFVQRIADWLSGPDGADASEDEIATEIETLADHVGGFEVSAAIEQEIVDTLQAQGVGMMHSIAQPGACGPCLDKAAADPVPISDFIPPPYHNRCRCSSASADQS